MVVIEFLFIHLFYSSTSSSIDRGSLTRFLLWDPTHNQLDTLSKQQMNPFLNGSLFLKKLESQLNKF